MRQKTPARLYLEKLVQKFPRAPTRQLALKAWTTHGKLFNNYEHARTMLRTIRGNCGDRCRKDCDKTLNRPNDRDGKNWKELLPKPRERKAWGHFEIPGPFRALVLSDIHVPFHDFEAVSTAIDLGRKDKCNLVILNGDILDNHAVSRWETDPRERDFAGELEACRGLLQSIRAAFPKARVIYKWGNHDERYDAYMRLKAPEFLDVPEFQLEAILRFDELRIESVKDQRPIHAGKLMLFHGHEYRFAISNPVNPARGLYLRSKVNSMCGHMHQTSSHSESDANRHVTTVWSTGCLCDVAPDYARLNKWNQGFARVDADKSGAFDVSNYRIVDGKVWR